MISGILRKVWNRRKQDVEVNIDLSRPSILVPAECWKSQANSRLIDLALDAIPVARQVDHEDIASKMIEFPHWPQIWPGEHYKLLSALVHVLKPKVVVEIGTATGYSALAMKKFLPRDGKLVSFDLVPWNEVHNCILTDADFEDGRLIQIIDDLTKPGIIGKYSEMLNRAELVFVDAAKDGIQEQIFIDCFGTMKFINKPIFVFDDIRLMNMISIWNNIEKPKLDLTSFGHWSGTGLVDWQ